MEDQSGWCTIESDPGVFTELVENIGVKDVEFQEVFSLDTDSLRSLGNILGLVFLFKFQEGKHQKEAMTYTPEGLFFAKQVIENACATQAILSVLLNATPDQVDIGDTLSQFKQFTEGLDDESRGYAIGNSDQIRAVHNSFRPNVSLEISHDEEKKKGEAFHFVSYVWVNGKVYELDGLQSGPIIVGDCPNRSDWVDIVSPHIQSRIAEYTSSGDDEIRFNLMAIVKDRRTELRTQLDAHSNPTDPLAEELRGALIEMDNRRRKWKQENIRRRHDFMPLALTCLQGLAEKGKLVELFQNAKEAVSNRKQ